LAISVLILSFVLKEEIMASPVKITSDLRLIVEPDALSLAALRIDEKHVECTQD
jgi:hypothetical protein